MTIKKVEQINSDAEVLLDSSDKPLTQKELQEILSNQLLIIDSKSIFIEKKDGILFYKVFGETHSFLLKNITYLGNPHPINKKRIQFNGTKYSKLLGKKNFHLTGVYKYHDNIIFCKWMPNLTFRGKNSSFHINSEDIRNATVLGCGEKEDKFNNNLIIVDSSNLHKIIELSAEATENIIFKYINEKILNEKWNIKKVLMEYPKNFGKEMKQSEWQGFYLEDRIKKDLGIKKGPKIKSTTWDFELDGCIYDVKVHSNDAGNLVPGNDLESLKATIDLYGEITYIIVHADVELDENHEYKEWHVREIKKQDYIANPKSRKLKINVSPTSFTILKITKKNFSKLKKFHQGINSDGKPRKTKVLLPVNSK